MGTPGSSHGISVEDEVVTPKIDVWASTPISHPQSFELAISSMKRGGVEFYRSQPCILEASPVWINTSATRTPKLTSSHPWSLYIQTFHPWSNRDTLGNVQRIAQTFLFTQPRGVSAVCCWGQWQIISHFVALSQSHSYLELVPPGHWWCTMPTQLAQLIERGVPLAGMMRKSQF